MKSILIILCLVSFNIFTQIADVSTLNLKGKVKSVTTQQSYINGTVNRLLKTEKQIFNTYGFQVLDSIYFEDTFKSILHTWSIDSSNRFTSSQTISKRKNVDTVLFIFLYEEDNIVKSISQSEKDVHLFEYYYDFENTQVGYSEFLNDELIEEFNIIKSANGISDTIKHLWSKGLENREQITIYHTSLYDDTVKYTIYEKRNPGKVECMNITWVNDSLGNLISYITENENNSITVLNYKYTYDSYGNWVTKELIQNEKVLYIWRRQISYYEN